LFDILQAMARGLRDRLIFSSPSISLHYYLL
jgi:hypothetical protein